MRLLLDTHVLLWAAMGSPRLSAEAAKLIASPAHTRIFSVASLWEIGFKSGLGCGLFSLDLQNLTGLQALVHPPTGLHSSTRKPLMSRT